MKKQCTVILETGEEAEVIFNVTGDEPSASGRVYGISAILKVDGRDIYSETAENRFFTYKEAESAIEMLCANQVTPCTLCDIL